MIRRNKRPLSRIADAFERLKGAGKTGLVAFTTVGFPDVEATLGLVPAMVDAGVDIVELGVPFSDPLADGATIQHASQVALQNGVTLGTCLDVCGRLRERLPLVPLLLMGYYNPILVYGLERFAKDAGEAGADGLIVPDLPPEEAGPLYEHCRVRGIDVVFMLAPTSTDERIQEVSRLAGGFVYCVSLTGVTGARADLPDELPAFVQRVRRGVDLPLVVGFGVSKGQHVRAIGEYAEAVAVGSALVRAADASDPKERLERVGALVAELRGGAKGRARSG